MSEQVQKVNKAANEVVDNTTSTLTFELKEINLPEGIPTKDIHLSYNVGNAKSVRFGLGEKVRLSADKLGKTFIISLESSDEKTHCNAFILNL